MFFENLLRRYFFCFISRAVFSIDVIAVFW
nr:MAG TPA: hypothetical protein [Caudoviricetes sp.]